MMNKATFEEEWGLIRSQSTAWWGLMAEFDLLKVDKAEVKFDKFVTLLQVKYGYTRQKAREELDRRLAEYKANKPQNEPTAPQVIETARSKTNGRSTRKSKTQASILQ